MKERPIIFSAPMVRAILEGRKTQTRRVVKPMISGGWEIDELGFKGAGPQTGHIMSQHPRQGVHGVFVRREIHPGSGKYEHEVIRSPYGQPGDRLWVREGWATVDLGYAPQKFVVALEIAYRADPTERVMAYLKDDVAAEKYTGAKFHSDWRSPLFMPRWASRILLEVVSVRVERLQDISDSGPQNDCTAEGVFHCGMTVPAYEEWHGDGFRSSEKWMYRKLWEDINGNGSWEANPWVWVVEFRRVQS